MASSYLIVGSADIEFSTDGAGYTAIGIIVSASRKDGGDKLEIKDRKGNVVAAVYFNAKNECEIDVIFETDTVLPTRGALLSLCGLTNVICDEIDHKWEQEKERMITIRGTRYEALLP
jgi:hypothetical protein